MGMRPRRTAGFRRTNDPPLLILISLAGGAKHGHALARDIEEFAGVRLSPGALYGAITRLEENGLIEGLPAQDRRRPYRLTASGAEALSQTVAEMDRITGEATTRLRLAGGGGA